MDVRVVSIGALATHSLWGEKSPARHGHATTTLIQAGDRVILIDPGLPDAVVTARLKERSGLDASRVTHVFLTSFMPETRRGIAAFPEATWWISEAEREAIGPALVDQLRRAGSDDPELRAAIERDIAILRQCEPAPERLARQVDLFPLPGVTPGLCGVLASGAQRTTLVCGDAIPTIEHLERGQVLSSAANIEQARESFTEAIEIADALILGRDNITPSPTLGRRPF